MRIASLLIAGLLFPPLAGFLQNQPSPCQPMQSSPADAQEIRQLETELNLGQNNGDPSFVENIYAADWTKVSGPEAGRSKARLLETLRQASAKPPYTVRQTDMHIYVWGNVAVAMYVAQYLSQEHSTESQLLDKTDVFVRSGRGWELKASRSSPHDAAAEHS